MDGKADSVEKSSRRKGYAGWQAEQANVSKTAGKELWEINFDEIYFFHIEDEMS